MSRMSYIMTRLNLRMFFLSTMCRGLIVPGLIFQWFDEGEATTTINDSEIYDPQQWTLETVCVAKSVRGQGVGRAVMERIQADLLKSKGTGMCGLCQSKGTKVRYQRWLQYQLCSW